MEEATFLTKWAGRRHAGAGYCRAKLASVLLLITPDTLLRVAALQLYLDSSEIAAISLPTLLKRSSLQCNAKAPTVIPCKSVTQLSHGIFDCSWLLMPVLATL